METKERIAQLLTEVKEKMKNAEPLECPEFLNDDRLEDAFKTPKVDENGYSEPLPTVYNNYGYGKMTNGVLILTRESASLVSSLYSKYLDDSALVWDSNKKRLLVYAVDEVNPKVAFKGSSWQFAKKIKPEYAYLSLISLCKELVKKQ